MVLGLAAPNFAQGLRVGVKAGVPLTTYFDTGAERSPQGGSEYSAATRRYTAGASVEWRWTHDFGFELDALYKRMGYVGIVSTFAGGISSTSALDAKGNSWDFPLMAKRRFGRAVRPYLAAGGVLRYIGPVRARGEYTVEDRIAGTTVHTPIDTTEPSELRKRLYPGLTAGGGIEFELRGFRILPELRYTRWTANLQRPRGLLRFNPNQVEVLLGLLF